MKKSNFIKCINERNHAERHVVDVRARLTWHNIEPIFVQSSEHFHTGLSSVNASAREKDQASEMSGWLNATKTHSRCLPCM